MLNCSEGVSLLEKLSPVCLLSSVSNKIGALFFEFPQEKSTAEIKAENTQHINLEEYIITSVLNMSSSVPSSRKAYLFILNKTGYSLH